MLGALAITPQSWMVVGHCLKASQPSPFPLSSWTQPLLSLIPGECRALAAP